MQGRGLVLTQGKDAKRIDCKSLLIATAAALAILVAGPAAAQKFDAEKQEKSIVRIVASDDFQRLYP